LRDLAALRNHAARPSLLHPTARARDPTQGRLARREVADGDRAAADDADREAASVPMLVVAGTADARVPAAAEAAALARAGAGGGAAEEGSGAAPSDDDDNDDGARRRRRVSVHLVEGAGHAGALDERVDLRAVLDDWRRGALARGGG